MVSPEEHTLGARLQKLREARGLSQEKLAFRSGISVSLMTKLEQGAKGGLNPNLATLQALARGLELPLLELMAELLPPAGRPRARKAK
jgi:transcriptional regulator with XRE-family HTH domain